MRIVGAIILLPVMIICLGGVMVMGEKGELEEPYFEIWLLSMFLLGIACVVMLIGAAIERLRGD